MESYFDVMAQHPNCLLAVDATDGGKWKSNFHIPQLINFQTHPKTWINFNANFNTDSGIKYTDDFEFEIDFEWNLTPEEFINNNKGMNIFYYGLYNSPIAIYMYADSRIGIWTSCGKSTSTGNVELIGTIKSISLSKGEHNLKLKYSYSKNTQEVIIDDNILYSISLYNSSLTLSDFITSNAPISNFNGGIYSATLTKTTDGARTIVWEAQDNEIKTNRPVMPTAPTGSGSFEETHGLLTKNNVEAENDYFKHTTTDTGYIETPLDLRGYAGDFTMISKAYIPSAGKAFTFFVQNNSRSRSSRFYYNDNNSNMVLMLNNSSDVRWSCSSKVLALDKTIPHVFAVTVSKSKKNVTFYVDGVLNIKTSLSSDFDYFSETKETGFSNIQIMQSNFANDGSFTYDFEGKLFASLFFNKELTADEIKILSDSMMEKNRGAKYIPFITPKNLTANDSDSEWKIFAAHSINSVVGVNPNSAEAWKAAAGMTSEAGWVTDRSTTGSGIWNVVLGWRRKDNKKFVVTKVTVGLYSKTPNEYGYYKWSSCLTNRPEGDYVIYYEDAPALFADAVPWVSQTTYDERVIEPEILPERYDEFSSKAFYLHFNYDLDPAEPELKNLGLNLLQLEGYVINEEPGTDLLCTTPTNLTSNTSNVNWECYTEPISTGTNAHSDTAYMAAAGFTGYASNTDGGRWVADKGTALTDTSAGVRFVWKRTDLEEWAVKRVILGNNLKSVFPQRIHHFILQGSNDGTTWTNIGEKQTPTVTMNVYNEQTFDYLSNTEKYKYWAINCNYDITWTDVAYAQFGAAANKIQFTNEI